MYIDIVLMCQCIVHLGTNYQHQREHTRQWLHRLKYLIWGFRISDILLTEDLLYY